MDNKTHEDSNTFMLTIICHGNKHGHLLDKNKSKAWDTEDFIGDLSEVETLLGNLRYSLCKLVVDVSYLLILNPSEQIFFILTVICFPLSSTLFCFMYNS